MSVFKRRTRTVSFRLSEEEYKELRDTCIAHGIRSISDLARLTTQWWTDSLPPDHPIPMDRGQSGEILFLAQHDPRRLRGPGGAAEDPSLPDSERRSRSISIRLSEGEYELLKTRYRTYGARNVSDLARLALQNIMAGSAGPPDDSNAKLAELDDRVHTLESQLRSIRVLSNPYSSVTKGEPNDPN